MPHQEVAVNPLAWRMSVPESLANNKDGLAIRETHAHLLPFMSRHQIKRTMIQLEDEGLIASYSTGRKTDWKIKSINQINLSKFELRDESGVKWKLQSISSVFATKSHYVLNSQLTLSAFNK